MGFSPEVTYNMFDPVGVLVDAVGLPIDLLYAIDVFVDPGGVSGVSIDFLDAMGVFLDFGGVMDATKTWWKSLWIPGASRASW
jgi:hypothetical protein